MATRPIDAGIGELLALPTNGVEVHVEAGVDRATRQPALVINTIHVPPSKRRRGVASRWLDSATAWADRYGVVLVLDPEPFADGEPEAPIELSDLIKFYESRGFVIERAEVFLPPIARGGPKRVGLYSMLRHPVRR